MKRSKTNTLSPVRTFSQLSQFEQADVKTAMRGYNSQYMDKPFFEIEEFYDKIYTKGGIYQ